MSQSTPTKAFDVLIQFFRRRFFYAHKTYVFYKYSIAFKIGHKNVIFSEFIVSKLEFEFSSFYCI